MLPANTKVISVDDHVIEPPDLWWDRLPDRVRDIGPRVVELDSGAQAWAYEDALVTVDNDVVQKLPGTDTTPLQPARFDEMAPGCCDPRARLLDMDIDGVWAQLCFPQFARFAGHRFVMGHDKHLAHLCVRAYNDFIIEEWAAAAPDRLLSVAILPWWDVEKSVAEVERVSQMGASAIAFSENPTVLGFPSVHSDHWDPLWSAVEASGLPLCVHIGSSSKLNTTSQDAPGSVVLALVGTNAMGTCADWLFSGVLERFPGIKLMLSEGGAGWVPYLLESAEKAFRIYSHLSQAKRPPTEIFLEHIYVCMLTEPFALQTLGHIPVTNLLWESDYPHVGGNFPNSRRRLEDAMADVPDVDARCIAETNARALLLR
jgi:predicted TIM-barrel fold metal-dependent hydrolase